MNTLTNEMLEGIASSAVSSERISMANELLSLRAQLAELREQEPVAFYAKGAYYNTTKAAIKDGASEIEELYAHPVPPAASQHLRCPYPCGWDKLIALAIQDGAIVACGLVEGEEITESLRHAAINNTDRLIKLIAHCKNASQPYTVPDEWRESLQEMVNAMRQYEMDVDECAPEKHRRMMRRADKLLNTCRSAMLQSGNHSEHILGMVKSPVGWVIVPNKPTNSMIDAGLKSMDVAEIYQDMIAAAPQYKEEE